MRNIIVTLVCLVTLFLVGCQEVKQEFSGNLIEDAVIVEAVYTPSSHDRKLGLTAFKLGPLGVDFSGNSGLRIGGGLQVSGVTVPEKFAVVFKCQHGKFIITQKEVYEKFKDHEGEKVEVLYREIYRTTYEKKDGKLEVISRVLEDYDFLSAEIK